MALLRVSESGQVYDIELPQVKVTRDEGGGYYVHGRGHWIFFATREEAEAKKHEIDTYNVFGGSR